MSEKETFLWMMNNVEEKLNEKNESIPEAATENDDTFEEKTQA